MSKNIIKALKVAGFTREQAKRICEIFEENRQPENNEWLYESIVSLCSDATGGNAAFDEEYGMDTLNELRSLLGLVPLRDGVKYENNR